MWNEGYYIQREPQVGLKCIFPFKYQDKLYYECSMKLLRNGIPWCPTKIENSERIVREGSDRPMWTNKNWGYCGAKC